MATERRPSKPVTRVPQSAGSVHSAPTTRMPQKSSGGPPTRSIRGGGHGTRSVPSARKSSLPVILGAAGGGLLLIIVVAVAVSGGSSGPDPASKKKKAGPAPVDVAAIEREAEVKCSQGLALIQKSEGMMTGRTLSAVEQTQLKNDLQRGVNLIQEGMNRFDEAYAKSGNRYDTTQYGKAYKAAKMKLGELK
jgi:hypothetical protein